MKKIMKNQKGITLVALVVTIVILLILAGISISTLTNTGIFAKAKDAKQASENAERQQKEALGEYEKELSKYTAQELTDEKINKVLSNTENTVLKDTNGNIFTVPAGFKIVVNDDTNNVKTVDKGIVIEDVTENATKGSQFVWVPVGSITKTDGTTIEINLNRYTFNEEGKATPQNENIVDTYFQELASSDKGNKVAKSIDDFKTGVRTNGGYYIGRYEARKNESGKLTEVNTDMVWNNITQSISAIQAQNMYDNSNFTSDLINSYAWDTATLFLQNCGTNKKYSRQQSLNTGSIATKGTTNDKQCNVYDMASNILEWTTETSNCPGKNCVRRGGFGNYSVDYTSYRYSDDKNDNGAWFGFRPILYINV